MKPVAWSAPAQYDAQDAALWYAGQGGLPLGERFLAELEKAIEHIGAHPQTGSMRYAPLLRLDELRYWPVKKFPYLIFYVEHQARIDVWRVLHAQRDIPAWMRDS